jgi:hypothetical protein
VSHVLSEKLTWFFAAVASKERARRQPNDEKARSELRPDRTTTVHQCSTFNKEFQQSNCNFCY